MISEGWILVGNLVSHIRRYNSVLRKKIKISSCMTYISIKAHVYVAHSMEFLHDNFNHLLPIGLGGGGILRSKTHILVLKKIFRKSFSMYLSSLILISLLILCQCVPYSKPSRPVPHTIESLKYLLTNDL